MTHHPRPKSGVYAVRAGPPLARNLRRALRGRPMRDYRPQREALSLISTGNRYAVASRGRWALEGAWVWRWKDQIDRRWMRKYSVLPEMEEPQQASRLEPGIAGPEALREVSNLAMRCGGCGAKVGSAMLNRILDGIPRLSRDDVVIGLEDPDDAAVIEIPPGRVLVQTVDFFRAIVDDPYLFGRVAANHCLGDVFAMNAEPQSALAIAVVPYGLEVKTEQQLHELMDGAVGVLTDAGAALVGGHTGEGAELAFGLTVNGLAELGSLLRKEGLRPGDRLVLSKALGTGTLFAADMRGKAKGRWVDAALESMLQSNRAAAACLFRHGARACTDVTGFGLLGHLMEMARPSRVDVEIELEAVPVLDGARETVEAGIFSSLQPQNVRLRHVLRNPESAVAHPLFPLLFDPQTAGGLLAAVPPETADACVQELRALGYVRSVAVGTVHEPGDPLEPVILRV